MSDSAVPPPATGIFDSPVHKLCINAAWWSHISGMITPLTYEGAWEGTQEEIDDAQQAIFKLLNVGLPTEECGDTVYLNHATLWHDESIVLAGGGFTRISPAASPFSIAGHMYNAAAYQSTFTNSDSFHQPFLIAAGDYNFRVLGLHNNVHGLADWYLDNVSFLTGQDWYASSIQPSIIKSGTVTIADSGLHDLKCIVNGKNGSALAYGLTLTKYWFEEIP